MDYQIESLLNEESGSKEYQILNAAIQSFAEKGFHSTKTKDIALRAGVAEGTIFRYFKTKDEIIQKMFPVALKLLMPKFANQLAAVLDKNGQMNLVDIVIFIVHDRVKLLSINRKIMLAILPEILYRDELKKSIIEIASNEISKVIEHIYETNIINPETLDKEDFKKIIFSTTMYFALSKVLFTEKIDEQLLHDEIATYIRNVSKDWSVVK